MTEHLIVDGMNVIGSRPDGWWRDRAGATRRLVARLQALASRGVEVTLVLDGRPLPDLPPGRHDGVEVTYARRPGRDAGDDRLVEVVAGLPAGSAARVVTSDRGLAERVRALGVEVTGAGRLLERLDRLGA